MFQVRKCFQPAVNPIKVDWNKNVVVRLDLFPGSGTGSQKPLSRIQYPATDLI